jgi:hypothetical protein
VGLGEEIEQKEDGKGGMFSWNVLLWATPVGFVIDFIIVGYESLVRFSLSPGVFGIDRVCATSIIFLNQTTG